ncbi:MAG: glycosyltransferase family 39 protein, partial [Bacteroidota bacterium]
MEIDAAQYALISMEMGFTKSFLEVYQQGNDYLDKPPLLFWLSSASMLLFGLTNFAYKLPSVLIALLGIYSTYKFAKDYYGQDKAILAALILGSCQAMFLITNDVRTDTNLLGLTMFSIWQLSSFIKTNSWKHLILASLGLGGAMMAKGPIALIIPAAAFGTEFLLKREWKNIFKYQWLILLIIIGITLIPMCYGLYTQFDLHPEKTVYQLEGPSGLRFFFWTQSFGRITGEIYWDNNTGPYYFLHTILWDFQPWIFLFIPALFQKIRRLITNRLRPLNGEEYITVGGFILMFIALSSSNYKLPHYIFVLFPFASIITASYIYDLKNQLADKVSKFQFGITHLLWVAIALVYIIVFPPTSFIQPSIFIILFIQTWVVFKRIKNPTWRIFIPTLITAISFNLMMAIQFYPNLLKFQATSQAG